MKKLVLLFSMAALCTLTFNSCKKSTVAAKTSASASLKFNGTPFAFTAMTASYSKSNDVIQIVGRGNSSSNIYLIVTGGVKVGTFDIATGAASATFSASASLQDSYMGATGTVTITSFTSNTVAGTFQFSGDNQAGATGVVTEGKFQCSYTNQ
ncbi:MAG: hypothetical protein JWP94_2303 [Mucilaginibacter sp.]|nr:hypothetical protein [Mucilaginibacter sp.]